MNERFNNGSECEPRQAMSAVVIALMLLLETDPAMATVMGQRAEAANENLQQAHTVSGTLAVLDVSAGKGMLKTDLDKPIFFKIGRPAHFERLSIGDRVTMQLDEEGRTLKVIKALPAEVHEPPPSP